MQLDQSLLDEATSLWNIDEEVTFIRRVANYIYYAPKAKVFFRLTESWHRSKEQIESELDWMFYLESKGVEFAHPLKSKNNQYCEKVNDVSGSYIVSVFKEARGKRIVEKEHFTPKLLESWGEVIGLMHKHTKNYVPQNVRKRFEWNEEEYHHDIVNLIKPEHGLIYNEFGKLEKIFSTYEKDKDSYGLIHADLHTGNFHVDDSGKIMTFDFDDAIYSWFIYDIVVFLWALERFELDWKMVQESIWKGYQKHNVLDKIWLQRMPEFYNYRCVLIHYYCLKNLNDPKLDSTSREWMEKRIQEYKDFFNEGAPYPFSSGEQS